MKAVPEMNPQPASTAIWERAIRPTRGTLDVAVARGLLELRLSKRDLDRADLLVQKSLCEGLSQPETRELEEYRAIGTALEFLKSKARLSLKAKK